MGGETTPRTAAERERLYELLWLVIYPDREPWPKGARDYADHCRKQFENLLAFAPQLWDSLPPDPAETARREAEEDGRMVESWRAEPCHYVLPVYTVTRLADRMTARAAAGYPVLIAPKGEK